MFSITTSPSTFSFFKDHQSFQGLPVQVLPVFQKKAHAPPVHVPPVQFKAVKATRFQVPADFSRIISPGTTIHSKTSLRTTCLFMYHQLFQARSLLVPTVKVLRPKYHQSFLVPPAFSRTTSFSKDNQRLFEDQQFFNKKPMSPQLKYLLSFQVPPMFFKRTTSFFKIKYDHSEFRQSK